MCIAIAMARSKLTSLYSTDLLLSYISSCLSQHTRYTADDHFQCSSVRMCRVMADVCMCGIGRVATLRAKSFQNLPLRFTMDSTDAVASSTFILNNSTGVLTLRTALTYALNQHLYTFNLNVTELYSDFISVVPVKFFLLTYL